MRKLVIINVVVVLLFAAFALYSQQPTNTLQWAGQALGAASNYGTSPGAVLVPGVNAFVTNTPSVAQSGTWNIGTVTSISNPVTVTGNLTNNNAAPTSSLVGMLPCLANSAAPSWTNGNLALLSCDLAGNIRTIVTNTVTISGTITSNQGTSPWVVSCTTANCSINVANWAGSALGAMANYGTSPGAVLVPGVNAFITNTPNVNIQANATVDMFGHTGAAVDAAIGAAPPTNAIQIGGLGSGLTGGEMISPAVGDTYKVINISTATTTLLISGVAGRKIRIGAIHFIAAGADNVALIEGTTVTTPCDTGAAGVAGGTTAASGYNLVANQGYTFGSGLGTVIQTATAADNLCIVTSAAVQLSGGIEYAIY